MEPSSDLFEGVSPVPTARTIARWQLVTNQRNLFYMLAAGLVMPPQGFGKKYYQDTLAAFPGWIPLFSGTVSRKAIEHSISERNHLIPCIVSVDLSAMRGRVLAVGADGLAREIEFPAGLDGGERLILVPAPLPVAWISSIAFRTREEKSSCEVDARDFGNVPLTDFKREIIARSITEAADLTWPPVGLVVTAHATALDAPFAAGGMMAMLLHMANRGDIGMGSCRVAFEPETSAAGFVSDPMISPLGDWMQTGHLPDNSDVLKKLFWGAVDKVTALRSSDVPVSPQDVALAHLESFSDMLDDRMKLALSKLSSDLRTLAGFTDSTITEIFERHPKPFSRVMMLFFLREKCADLLEFRHPLLTESDYVAAAILFAARDGWLGLPIQLRDIPGLQAAVSHRMAAMSHRMSKTGIDLGLAPPRPIPLRELFFSGPKGWVNTQKEAVLLLARECKWECIQTRVSLGKGEYRVIVDGAGVHIILAGEAKAVVTEVDREKFYSNLALTPISSKLDRKIRDALKA